MANVRVSPPADGKHGTITVNGRTYTAAVGTSLDVPDFDGALLEANGWLRLSIGAVGTTAQRPAKPAKNDRFLDTTIGASVVFDGIAWRHHLDNSAV